MLYDVQNPIQQAMGMRTDTSPTPQYPSAQKEANPNIAGTASSGYQVYSAMSGPGASTASAYQGPGMGAAVSGNGSSAGTGAGAMGWIGGLGAAIYADETLARNTAGTWDDPNAAWENNVRGITRYGGISPGMTALLEDKVGRDNLDNIFKVFDPIGITEKIEGPIADATAGTIPEFLGGTGDYDPIGSAIGSFLFS